ncbi:MAG: bifunctional phosphoribosylaminoimidazolecarboxamide formyltransferase/IMP cyclohydrolase [Acidobacteria bacterium]|nr:bifunctional phosphoribosylaminoimidazolecarboxamide formyltransferase/IMP cyclohydrolase [Acidobacteriota bacterium]
MQEQLLKKISRSLISVSDKTSLVEFARKLAQHGIEIISTGGTAKLLRENGLNVRDVSDVTGFPEMLDGRVKTLHPIVHGGILGIRDNEEHRAKMREHDIEPIDLVVVNLYPFAQATQKPGVTMSEAIENIDIGGPAMIRSAAKNFNDVAVVVDPADYAMVGAMLDAQHGSLPQVVRYQLALKAFRHTADYDREIARFLGSRQAADRMIAPDDQANNQSELLEEIELDLKKMTDLRYGENPHQRAALYRLSGSSEVGVATAEQLQGKELSYNNLIDSDAAWELVMEIHRMHLRESRARGAITPRDIPHTCAIIKHTNPCGIGVAATAVESFKRARATDPVSAFGGIIAFSQIVDGETAKEIAEMFAEVIIAPDFTDEAKQVLNTKKNLRVLRMREHEGTTAHLELRRIGGGILVQDRDAELIDEEKFKIVSERNPTSAELRALHFAWAICKHVKSNAIVYAGENQLMGVGAGQMSRVDSVKIGAMKAQLPLEGSVLASDAFFPFRDGVDEAAKHGITAIIQPGGSMRDKEVVEAANEHNLALVFTGIRHFKH